MFSIMTDIELPREGQKKLSASPKGTFDEVEIEIMERALCEAWCRLQRVAHPMAKRELEVETRTNLSTAILELAATGERDWKVLADYAIKRLHDF